MDLSKIKKNGYSYFKKEQEKTENKTKKVLSINTLTTCGPKFIHPHFFLYLYLCLSISFSISLSIFLSRCIPIFLFILLSSFIT